MQHTRLREWGPLTLLGIAALVLAGCGSTPAATGGGEAAPAAATSAPAAGAGEKIALKLAENPWTGSSVNVNVAKILLEEQLGYTVELITIDENAQWAALANGDLSASMEIWPSGHAENLKQYVTDQKVVEELGPLGVEGKIGWFMPSYVVEQKPELATWEGFKQAGDAALFKTAETGELGQFLAGDPSWVQYDNDIIKNLNLPLQVVNAGSEQAVLAAVDAAYSRNEPILFYFWKPHSIHAKYKLTQVELPAYSADCYAKAEAGGVACDYPKDVLLKVAWSGLKDKAPDAYNFLKAFSYTTDDQIKLIAGVELDKQTAEAVARDWIAKNESTWKPWVGK